MKAFSSLFLCLLSAVSCASFVHQPSFGRSQNVGLAAQSRSGEADEIPRREVLAGLGAAVSVFIVGNPAMAAEEEDSFAAIAARASQISKEVDKEIAVVAANIRETEQTAYEFELPYEAKQIKFGDLINQQFLQDGVRVKAILVVNLKQDDPMARRAIPELISLATKYSRNQDGALAVMLCPTDQGYYEPDTSTLIRLKLASEYGFGINPATSVTDKVNLLGTGAHPFMRWLQGTCRTPAGLGRIEGNFEKFLLDGLTGLPLRRYPRRYSPLNIADDIEAVIAGRPLPPAKANYLEEWRTAAAEAERDTYRFQKGVNVFDQ